MSYTLQSKIQNPKSAIDLSIIIVSWNVWDLLRACLQSIERISRPVDASNALVRAFGPGQDSHTLEVIVVDSASSDATVDGVRARFPWVRVIASPENLGFTRGNNRGYAESRGEFVFFLNPDTEIISTASSSDKPNLVQSGAVLVVDTSPSAPRPPQDSLWTLYCALQNDPQVGMVGPQLRYADGALQSSRRRFPTRSTGFFESTWLGLLWPDNPWSRRLHMADWPATIRHDVDWVVGAAMMARRAALAGASPEPKETSPPNLLSPLERGSHRHAVLPSPMGRGVGGEVKGEVGPFDEGFFMYSEELDLCRRIKTAGWHIVYVPEATVVHYEGRSSEQVTAARHIHFNTSKVRYYRKAFGNGWAEGLRRYLLLEFRLQLALEWLKWRVGHKRLLRAARLQAYREVIRSQLK